MLRLLYILGWLWRRFGDVATLDFLLQLLDYKTGVVGLVGVVLTLFVSATNFDWSPQLVFLAALFGGACVAAMFAFIRVALQSPPVPKYGLAYLNYRDAELGPSIIQMASKSAWGRWFAAQYLVSSERPIAEGNFLQIASHVVMDEVVNGNLAVRGRKPRSSDYESIPREHWRSSAFHFIPDPISLWRMILLPRGGATVDPDGTVKAHNPQAEARNSKLQEYDSLVVDAEQFEKLWPARDRVADKLRQRFLQIARKRKLDADEIERLS